MTKRRIDILVYGSAQTITVDKHSTPDDIGVIDEGGVAIDNGKIIQAASSQLLERKFSPEHTIYADDEVIMPGLVDPHTHLVFAGSREREFQERIQGRSYLGILAKGGGILETVSKTRQTSMSELATLAEERARVALENGTTTLEVKTGYGLRTTDELKMLQVAQILKKRQPCRIISTFLGAHAIPRNDCEDEYTRVVIDEMLPAVRDSGLAEFCDVFCEKGAFNYKHSIAILQAASRSGLRLKIHADQFTDSRGAEIANEIKSTSADHLVHSPFSQLGKLARTGVTPVLLPGSSHSLLSERRARAQEMLSLGLPVALGSDFSPSNWILGQLAVGALAARELRMSAEDIIRGITINAAKALGIDRTIGSLRPGKAADLVTIKASNYKWIGYSYGEDMVDKVMIGGKLVVDGGQKIR
ncbi:MAG TPA: imidazolonepropionase [Candidatus Bathyarchaeia archaeon]|nr:imidazolonepropionase [Candidatus Bathyarchaeia archaeon]